jgi:pimeloyl-ACP methyl ester carboxylesterase
VKCGTTIVVLGNVVLDIRVQQLLDVAAPRLVSFTSNLETQAKASMLPIAQTLPTWMNTMAPSLKVNPMHFVTTSDKTRLYVKDRTDLSAFAVPTLIIHGTQDKIVPIDASSLLDRVRGAPHGLFATHKSRLTQDLLNFIRR